MLKIKNWQSRFENNRSKQVESARWFPMPNALDTETQCTILGHEKGAEIFASWTLILQLASRCKRRGELTREDGTPLNIATIAMMTRARAEWLEIAIPVLLQVGEIELLTIETSGERQANVTPTSGERQETAQKGREGIEENGKNEPAPPIDENEMPDLETFCEYFSPNMACLGHPVPLDDWLMETYSYYATTVWPKTPCRNWKKMFGKLVAQYRARHATISAKTTPMRNGKPQKPINDF